MIWSYFALGEYCETNNVDGFQENGDVLIQLSPWTSATWNDITAGVTTEVSVM
jgi:hypothetical protein